MREQNFWYPLHKLLCMTITNNILYEGIVIFMILQRAFLTWIELIYQQSPGELACFSEKKTNKISAGVATQQESDFLGLDVFWRKFLGDGM